MFAQRFRPVRRGTILATSAALVLLVLLVAGCTSNRKEEKGGAAPIVAGHFVGEATPSTTQHTFVAIAASSAEQGSESREVKAYLCDGQQISEWFRGSSVTGNDLDLTSDSGAQLKGSLAPDAATGTITLPDREKSFTFTVKPASGPAGLYNVSIADDGGFVGTSERGGRMEGRLAQEADSRGEYPFSGTVTPPEGEPQSFEVKANDFSPGDSRVIVSEDLHMVGSGDRRGSARFLVCKFL